MSRIIFNSPSDWVYARKYSANMNTRYNNTYPYNVMYFDGTTLTADCVNFDKSLFNGRDVYHMAPNSCQRDLSNTGDCTELGLLNQCADVSADFTRLKAGEPRVLYMDGHIGNYIGENVNINGNLYNVIECTGWTGDFGHDGIIYSWVDSDGTRRAHKGGAVSCKWEKHGLPNKWVNYSNVAPQPAPTPQPTPITKPDVYYAVKTAESGWLPFVKNLDDYAGLYGQKILDVAIRVTNGDIWYQSRTVDGRMLGVITGCDINDFDYGFAGDDTPMATLVAYYTTPQDIINAMGYLRAKYRVHILGGEWLDWQYDNEVGGGQDGYAGIPGVAIDGLQMILE